MWVECWREPTEMRRCIRSWCNAVLQAKGARSRCRRRRREGSRGQKNTTLRGFEKTSEAVEIRRGLDTAWSFSLLRLRLIIRLLLRIQISFLSLLILQLHPVKFVSLTRVSRSRYVTRIELQRDPRPVSKTREGGNSKSWRVTRTRMGRCDGDQVHRVLLHFQRYLPKRKLC